MNKVFVAGFVFLAFIVVLISTSVIRLGDSPTGQIIKDSRVGQLRQISITGEGFEPEILFARKGDRIRFTNNGLTPETATSEYFGSPLLFPEDTYDFIIIEENITIEYFSMSNSGFRGSIRVLE